MLAYGDWVEERVLASVPHRQYVFTVPRMLRPIFSRRRGLLGELCHIVEHLLTSACSGAGVKGRPGLILFVQTVGDLLTFDPHIHVLAADGVFRSDGVFAVLPGIPVTLLEQGFRSDIWCATSVGTRRGLGASGRVRPCREQWYKHPRITR